MRFTVRCCTCVYGHSLQLNTIYLPIAHTAAPHQAGPQGAQTGSMRLYCIYIYICVCVCVYMYAH